MTDQQKVLFVAAIIFALLVADFIHHLIRRKDHE